MGLYASSIQENEENDSNETESLVEGTKHSYVFTEKKVFFGNSNSFVMYSRSRESLLELTNLA